MQSFPPQLLHSSALILTKYNHSGPPSATEQLGTKFLRAFSSALVFKRGESVTLSASPTGPVLGFKPCLIVYIAFTAP